MSENLDEIVKEAMRRGVEYGFNLGSQQTLETVIESIGKLVATGAADKWDGRSALEKFAEALRETPLDPLELPQEMGGVQ